jgi:hypothetical protein
MSRYMEIADRVRRRRAVREALMPAPPLDDPAADERRQRLLAMLAEGRAFAVLAEPQPDGSYRIAFGNGSATCEFQVPAPRDPLDFALGVIRAAGRR